MVVAETANFSIVARRLGLKRSSVSRAVASFERSLGVQLFSRTTRRVALTSAGEALYAKVVPRLLALREALGALPEREQVPLGLLRITAPSDLGLLPPLLAGFCMRYPAIEWDVRLTNRPLDLVGDGIDVALRVSSGKLAD